MSSSPESPPKNLLIDVRTPTEFATGALISDIAPTINIEYTLIHQLAEIYAAQGIHVSKDDNITLYCRSGRRSAIAKGVLEEEGWRNVRDIGGLEDARRVLDREMVGRQLERQVGEVGEVEGKEDGGCEGKGKEGEEERQKSFGELLAGLRDCEE